MTVTRGHNGYILRQMFDCFQDKISGQNKSKNCQMKGEEVKTERRKEQLFSNQKPKKKGGVVR